MSGYLYEYLLRTGFGNFTKIVIRKFVWSCFPGPRKDGLNKETTMQLLLNIIWSGGYPIDLIFRESPDSAIVIRNIFGNHYV